MPTKRGHTILLAIDAAPTLSAGIAMRRIAAALRGTPLDPYSLHTIVESWHFAEDARTDSSDSQSAVFCRTGCQEQARAVLEAAGLA